MRNIIYLVQKHSKIYKICYTNNQIINRKGCGEYSSKKALRIIISKQRRIETCDDLATKATRRIFSKQRIIISLKGPGADNSIKVNRRN